MRPPARFRALAICFAAFLPVTSGAATVLGSVANASGEYNLTNHGILDWAYWSTTSTSGFNGSPNQSKTAASLIGSLTALGGEAGSTLRGSGSTNVANTFAWTLDGSPTPSGTSGTVRGVFNEDLDELNAGVRLTITIPTTEPYYVYLWTGIFGGTATLTASFDGGTTPIYTSPGEVFDVGNPKGSHLHTLVVTADSPGAILTIDNVLTDNGTAGNSHSLFSGAAISLVPEPTALLLSALGLLPLLRRKR